MSRTQRGQKVFNWILREDVYVATCRNWNNRMGRCKDIEAPGPDACPHRGPDNIPYLHLGSRCTGLHRASDCSTPADQIKALPHSLINARGPEAQAKYVEERRNAHRR